MKLGLKAKSAAEWSRFAGKYRAEMMRPEAKHDIELLAAFSRATDFSVGCYCQDEARCHRSILKQLLMESGAKVA